jgi:hypothetical protein
VRQCQILFNRSGWIGTVMHRRGSAIDKTVSAEGSKEALEEGKLRGELGRIYVAHDRDAG